MIRILFVCTGNTCRSPMAQALAEQWLKEHNLENEAVVSSAGLAAFPGLPASPAAVAVIKKRNLKIDGHNSRLLDGRTVSETDIIFVMTSGHRQHLLSIFPQTEGKVKMLSTDDIRDPFGGSPEDYERCAAQLEQAIGQALAEIFFG